MADEAVQAEPPWNAQRLAHLFEADWAADVASLLGIASDRVTIVDHEPVPVPAGKSYFPSMTFDLLPAPTTRATMHEHVYEIKEALPWDGVSRARSRPARRRRRMRPESGEYDEVLLSRRRRRN